MLSKFAAQPISIGKVQSRKKAHLTLRTSSMSQKMCQPCFIIIESHYFDCRIHAFSLRDLSFVLCSRDLDVLRAQRIIGFLILITHKWTRSENENETQWSTISGHQFVKEASSLLMLCAPSIRRRPFSYHTKIYAMFTGACGPPHKLIKPRFGVALEHSAHYCETCLLCLIPV